MPINIHHGGKMGDMIYALPVMKAIARIAETKIHIVTSPLCFQLVPLLWEQPWVSDVEMDCTQPYSIKDNCIEPWQYFSTGEGINLSPQPAMYRPSSPRPWTEAYMEIAGIERLEITDRIALPTLWNHRQWYWEHEVRNEKSGEWKPHKICILAPESDSLRVVAPSLWEKVADLLSQTYGIIVVGEYPDRGPQGWPNNTLDLRGKTTVSSMARLLSEAYIVISALSLPFHLARHAGTPAYSFQDQRFERSVPVDTPCRYVVSEYWQHMVEECLELAKNPQTTLWNKNDLERLKNAGGTPKSAD